MRNLKRVLSLALALVMVLGMMVITTSAADYADADEITYTEAVEVMSAIGILEGDGTNFNPTDTLTREQAAKILAYVCLGTDAADYLTGESEKGPFDDVAATKWSAKFIAFCKNAKIIDGVGDNKFNPAGTLTTVQFAKMLLVAVGIDGEYTGSGWDANVKAAVEKNDLDVITIDHSDISREEACELALAAMKWSTTPEVYNIVKDGKVVKSFEDMLEAHLYASILTKGEDVYTVKTAEPTDTLLKSVYKVDFDSDTTDDFGRPAVSYTNTKAKLNLVYAAEADLTVPGADWKVSDLTDEKITFEGTNIVYNGCNEGFTAEQFEGLNGVTVEAYIDQDDNVTDLIVTEAYVTVVKNVETDDDDVTTVEMEVREAGYYIANDEYATVTINSEDNKAVYAKVKDFAKDDVFMGYWAPNWENEAKLLKVDAVETVEGKVTSSSIKGYYEGWVKIDGEKAEFANEYSQATVGVKSEGTFYLYNGYIVDFVADEPEDPNFTYGYVVAADDEGGLFADATYYAKVLNAEGEVEVIEVTADATELVGTVVTVTEGTKKDAGKYVLADAEAATDDALAKNTVSQVGGTYNNKTVVVVETIDDKGNSTYTVYTGVKNIPALSGDIYAVANDKGVVVLCYAMAAELVPAGPETSKDIVYVGKVAGPVSELIGEDVVEYYTYKAIVNGEITTIDATVGTLAGLYTELTLDDNGMVTAGVAMTDNEAKGIDVFGDVEVTAVAKDGVLAGYIYDDTTVVYSVAKSGAISASSIDAIEKEDTISGYATNGVLTMVIVK